MLVYQRVAINELKLEVPTIYKAYFSGLNFREYPYRIWPYMVQYLHFRILKFPLINHNPEFFIGYHLTGAFYFGNGWVAGGCWDDYY